MCCFQFDCLKSINSTNLTIHMYDYEYYDYNNVFVKYFKGFTVRVKTNECIFFETYKIFY